MNAITDYITSIFLKIKEDIQCHSDKSSFLLAFTAHQFPLFKQILRQ